MSEVESVTTSLRPFVVAAKSGYMMSILAQHGSINPGPIMRTAVKLRGVLLNEPYILFWRRRAIAKAAGRKAEIMKEVISLTDQYNDRQQFDAIKAQVLADLAQALDEAEQRILQD